MKIVTVVGARPQFVKAAVVSRALSEISRIREIIVHTGQHYDTNMSDVFFEEMQIPAPKYNLAVSGKSHGAMTGEMLTKTEEILQIEKPDMVLVYGDTNSTLAGTLAASKMNIPVAHVEAGLRSFNMKMPEEINRVVTDRLSGFLFCPTETSVSNLLKEGVEHTKVHLVGDVMFDAAIFYKGLEKASSKIKSFCEKNSQFVLATVHRAENTDELSRLSEIFSGLRTIGKDIKVILPLHPRTQKIARENNMDLSGLEVVEPVGYFDMLELLANCKMVFTDSGGVQKESYFFKKPCVTMRDETEWVELVEEKFNRLVGANAGKIKNAFLETKYFNYDFSKNLYGDGQAAKKIARIL